MRTRIYNTYPGKQEYLMNTITVTSRFKTVSCPAGMQQSDPKAQMIMAEEIVSGWKMNGNHPVGTTYRIEQEF